MFNKKLKEYKKTRRNKKYTNADENYYITANTVLNLAQKAYKIFQSSKVSEKNNY
jgi:hypothetical protein